MKVLTILAAFIFAIVLVASTPKEFATRIVAEIEMWAKVIQAANIKPQ